MLYFDSDVKPQKVKTKGNFACLNIWLKRENNLKKKETIYIYNLYRNTFLYMKIFITDLA